MRWLLKKEFSAYLAVLQVSYEQSLSRHCPFTYMFFDGCLLVICDIRGTKYNYDYLTCAHLIFTYIDVDT